MTVLAKVTLVKVMLGVQYYHKLFLLEGNVVYMFHECNADSMFDVWFFFY